MKSGRRLFRSIQKAQKYLINTFEFYLLLCYPVEGFSYYRSLLCLSCPSPLFPDLGNQTLEDILALCFYRASQVTLVVKSLPANAGDFRDTVWIPGSRRCPGGGHGNPFQYFCLENPMDRGAWWNMGSHRVGHYWSDLATQHSSITISNTWSVERIIS